VDTSDFDHHPNPTGLKTCRVLPQTLNLKIMLAQLKNIDQLGLVPGD